MDKKQIQPLRCAIYTRKSSEEGLDMEFNSLDAQREDCEAYIASQKSQGWVALETHYDDGGVSGGTLERPALKRLMEDIENGKVDSVIVYKIDRLSRSLMDFVKMVEVFDRHNVTFVSITQSFNTTNSMGRLMLNILLSFAQFEREVISERIRDKFAASRKKGMWMGGTPPMGYDVIDRKLKINPKEAKIVREIFEGFASTQSCNAVLASMRMAGHTTKEWVTQKGRLHEGKPMHKNYIYRILNNRVYLGEAVHKGESFPGEHEAIIDPLLWEEAHRILSLAPKSRGNKTRGRQPALLKGLVRCACCGSAMTPSSTGIRTNGKSYRYYVCLKALREGYEICPIRSIAAGELERAVLYQIKSAFKVPEIITLIENQLVKRSSNIASEIASQSERENLVRTELDKFDELWDMLFIQEKRVLLCEFIESIDVSESGIDIHFKKNGMTVWIEGAHHERRNDSCSAAA
ncbi:MAG: recombinase family protein [Bdellovibrionales bacterium]